jgi:hypothetical protein
MRFLIRIFRTEIIVSFGEPGKPRPLAGGVNVPPKNGERALLLLLSKEQRSANIIGDLAEEYSQIRGEHGKKFADFWYWKQVATSMGPILRKLLRIGLVSWIGEWVRRNVS